MWDREVQHAHVERDQHRRQGQHSQPEEFASSGFGARPRGNVWFHGWFLSGLDVASVSVARQQSPPL
jgi:hypothetical protein